MTRLTTAALRGPLASAPDRSRAGAFASTPAGALALAFTTALALADAPVHAADAVLEVAPPATAQTGPVREVAHAPLHPADAQTGPVREVAKAQTYAIAGGKGTAEIVFDGPSGSPESALTRLTLQPGAAVPPHVHEKSVEFLYVLEGEAEMMVAGEKLKVAPGMAVRIPMNTLHEAKVTGERALRVVQFYTPAGPEQRFVTPPAPAR